MTKRVILGGIVAGIAMFVWGSVSHMVLPLGEAGIKNLPNEEVVTRSLTENIKEPGFYFFPGPSQKTTKEESQAWEEKYRRGPVGIMIYHPNGRDPITFRLLAIEALSDIICAWIAAFILAKTLGNVNTLLGKALLVSLIGLSASVAIDLSYWNWYGFPTQYF